jgi:hypothetical protein
MTLFYFSRRFAIFENSLCSQHSRYHEKGVVILQRTVFEMLKIHADTRNYFALLFFYQASVEKFFSIILVEKEYFLRVSERFAVHTANKSSYRFPFESVSDKNVSRALYHRIDFFDFSLFRRRRSEYIGFHHKRENNVGKNLLYNAVQSFFQRKHFERIRTSVVVFHAMKFHSPFFDFRFILTVKTYCRHVMSFFLNFLYKSLSKSQDRIRRRTYQ